MGFDKRYIKYENLVLIGHQSGTQALINYIRKPDCLVVDYLDGSKEVVDIIKNNNDIDIIESELKRINFYEFN